MVYGGREHRRHQRMPFSQGVRFRQLEDGDPEAGLQGLASDLSRGGLAISTAQGLHSGHVLKLELDLGGGESLRAFALVAWCRAEGGGHRAGLRFVGIGEADEARIDEVVARYFKGGHRKISRN